MAERRSTTKVRLMTVNLSHHGLEVPLILRSLPRNRTEHRFSTKLCLLVDYRKET